jgi:TonB family protein
MSPTTETKTVGFIFGSGLLHVTTVAVISMMNLQPQEPNIEMIEFEVAASQGVQTEIPAAPPAPAPAAAEPVAAKPVKSAAAKPVALQAEPAVAQALPVKTAVAEPVQEIVAHPIQEVAAESVQKIAELAEATENLIEEPTAIEAATVETPVAVAVTETETSTVRAAVAEATEAVPSTETAAPAAASEVAPATSDVPIANGTEAQSTGAAFGVADGVRQLEQLKQKPGNKRPSYDNEDRLRGRQGKVSLLAYISKDGRPVQFKMLQSSGHRSLDLKTLAAVKSWRFYPGQEGWVEIPIQWDLRGRPEEAPATLRRQGTIN